MTALVALVAVAVAGGVLLSRPVALPIDLSWRGGCGVGVGIDATLRGSPSDAQVTWAVDRSSGNRLELLWPVGYQARFSPQLELLNDRGLVVGHDGDLIIGRCLMDPADGGAARVDAGQIRPPTWQPGDG